MGLADAKKRQKEGWNGRYWNLVRQRARTSRYNMVQFTPLDLKTLTIIQVPDSSGAIQQQVMDMECWEAAKNGHVNDFIACLDKVSKEKEIPVPTIFSQVTAHDQDTLLHVAAKYGNEELTDFIADIVTHLIPCKNKKGDSALHLAARAGHGCVVEILLTTYTRFLKNLSNQDGHIVLSTTEEKVAFDKLRLEERVAVNDEGNTPLHEALVNGHKDVAEYLISQNLEAAYHVNKQGKSPLYMAVEAGNFEFVKNILLGRSKYMHLLDAQLSTGKSLLHAAIKQRSIAILQELATEKPMLIHVKDEDGLGPLAFATSTGFLEGVDFLKNGSKRDNIAKHVGGPKECHENRPYQKPEIPKRLPGHGGGQHSMDFALYIAAKKGDVDGFASALFSKKGPCSLIYKQVTPLGNSFLHVAASFGREDLAEFIINDFPKLLKEGNHKGNTALHVAARAGHLGVVEILVKAQLNPLDIDVESNNGTVIAKYKRRVAVNNDGNTPLHEALMGNHEKVATYLIKANIEDAYHVNKQGKSAFYMAIEAEKIDCVNTILSTRLSYKSQHILDQKIAKGKSLVHATIKARNIVLLRGIADMKHEIIHVKDSLHYAASINFLEGVQFLLDKFKMNVYVKDSHGSFPIHCASKYGHTAILEKLLQYYPDVREFLNEDGRNILHVAAFHGKDSVVSYILKTPGFELLLNDKDKNGNTALHLAAMKRYPKVISSLTWDKRVDLKAVNNTGKTALQVAEEYVPPPAPLFNARELTRTMLLSAGVPRAKVLKYYMPYAPFVDSNYKDRVNSLLLVSTLIVIVTFAAGFTMPYGNNSDQPDQGMSTLVNKPAFQAYVICDTIAMYSAIMVAVSLIWAFGHPSIVLNVLKFAVPLLGISLTMMSSAFMVRVYLVVSKFVWLGNLVLVLGTISLAIILALFFLSNLPYSSKFPISRYITYYPFCILMLASGTYYDPEVEGYELDVEEDYDDSDDFDTDDDSF